MSKRQLRNFLESHLELDKDSSPISPTPSSAPSSAVKTHATHCSPARHTRNGSQVRLYIFFFPNDSTTSHHSFLIRRMRHLIRGKDKRAPFGVRSLTQVTVIA